MPSPNHADYKIMQVMHVNEGMTNTYSDICKGNIWWASCSNGGKKIKAANRCMSSLKWSFNPPLQHGYEQRTSLTYNIIKVKVKRLSMLIHDVQAKSLYISWHKNQITIYPYKIRKKKEEMAWSSLKKTLFIYEVFQSHGYKNEHTTLTTRWTTSDSHQRTCGLHHSVSSLPLFSASFSSIPSPLH